MGTYRVTVNDKQHGEAFTVEVDADSISTAILRAGILVERRASRAIELIDLVKVEKSAGWSEVKIP